MSRRRATAFTLVEPARVQVKFQLPTVILEEVRNPDRTVRDAALFAALRKGWNSAKLADAAGISRQAVEQKFFRRVDLARVQELEARFPAPTRTRTSWVRHIDLVPQDVIDLIVEKQKVTSTVRGWTPLDAPERAEIPSLVKVINSVLADYDVSISALSVRCGLSRQTLDFWMKRHGEGALPPSMKGYRGVTARRGRKRQAVVLVADQQHDEESIGRAS